MIDRLLRLGNAPVGDAEFDRRFLILSRQTGYVMMIFGDHRFASCCGKPTSGAFIS